MGRPVQTREPSADVSDEHLIPEKRFGDLVGKSALAKQDPSAHSAQPVGRTSPRPERTGTTPGAHANTFVPREPSDLAAAGITSAEATALVLKVLLKYGAATGSAVATQIGLPFQMVSKLLAEMKVAQRIVYKNTAGVTDYCCELTSQGVEHARRYYEQTSYCGTAPVALDDYIASVRAQSIGDQRPTLIDLQRAMGDLVVSPKVVARLAQAVRAGRGLFLHGAPGNGKTSMAERIAQVFGQQLWIPYAVSIDGEIVKLYDPCCHEELPRDAAAGGEKVDARWVCIRRPTVWAGGELTMDRLEVTINRQTGVCEAPLQMKSNCGTLVIDDFGRQRMDVRDLLNRWIVPLEKRFDIINLPSGQTIRMPFDQLIVFSTNLEPKSLVDEAFLRRIPYKIEVQDPTEEEFCELFRRAAVTIGIPPDSEAVRYLLDRHYRPTARPLRGCHPRDLVQQVQHYCEVHCAVPKLTQEALDVAVENYFSIT